MLTSGIKAMPTLRGLMTRWLNASLSRRTCLRPIDALLGHPDEVATHVKCDDPELTKAFWNMIRLLRHAEQDSKLWHTLFKGDLRRVLEVRKRFADPTSCSDVLWLTGDATLETVACVNRNDKVSLKEVPKRRCAISMGQTLIRLSLML